MKLLHPRIAACLAVFLGGAVAPAAAALVEVKVVDTAGRPLADAVALLEPVAGRAVVKPLADVEISQAKRQFAPRVTVVTVGTRASFPNFDTVRHHVYSFSAAKAFELKLYAGVPNVPITFDKPGVVVLGCNIHDQMAAWVLVADTPWFARSADDGAARVDGVPAGSYRLRVWHPALATNIELPTSNLTVGATNLATTVRLGVTDQP